MDDTFIRFVTVQINESSGTSDGVFGAAYTLLEGHELTGYDREALKELLDWFKDELVVPDRFTRARRPDAPGKAVSWFKPSATEYIARVRSMCHILNEYGIATQTLTTTRPGYVLFEDDHQVAAIPVADTF